MIREVLGRANIIRHHPGDPADGTISSLASPHHRHLIYASIVQRAQNVHVYINHRGFYCLSMQ